MRKKILLIFGTRPEAIKMAPLALALKQYEEFEYKICVTAQHREMLDQVMELFHLKADYDLDIMKTGQTLEDVTCEVLRGTGAVISDYDPDMILVHGDTTTSMAAAMASFYAQKSIGHVEAGLRTYDKYSPYPEEINRQIVDQLSDLYFAPTEVSKDNLLREGKPKEKIVVTGNTVIDAMKYTIENDYSDEIIKWVGKSKMILITTHRRENWGKPMENIFHAVNRLSGEFPDLKFVFPMHYNPKVRSVAKKILSSNEQIKLIDPLDVRKFHNYMKKSFLIMTDSGGIQEEAPSLGKPVLVLRDTTERLEGIEAGTLKLVGTECDNIYHAVKLLLTDEKEYKAMSDAVNPYGDGFASEKIIKAMSDHLEVME